MTDDFGSGLSVLLISRDAFCPTARKPRVAEWGAAGPSEAPVTGFGVGLRVPEAQVLPCPSCSSCSLAEVGAGLVLGSHSSFTVPLGGGGGPWWLVTRHSQRNFGFIPSEPRQTQLSDTAQDQLPRAAAADGNLPSEPH